MAELSHEELQQLLETQAEQIRHLQLALAQREIGDPQQQAARAELQQWVAEEGSEIFSGGETPHGEEAQQEVESSTSALSEMAKVSGPQHTSRTQHGPPGGTHMLHVGTLEAVLLRNVPGGEGDTVPASGEMSGHFQPRSDRDRSEIDRDGSEISPHGSSTGSLPLGTLFEAAGSEISPVHSSGEQSQGPSAAGSASGGTVEGHGDGELTFSGSCDFSRPSVTLSSTQGEALAKFCQSVTPGVTLSPEQGNGAFSTPQQAPAGQGVAGVQPEDCAAMWCQQSPVPQHQMEEAIQENPAIKDTFTPRISRDQIVQEIDHSQVGVAYLEGEPTAIFIAAAGTMDKLYLEAFLQQRGVKMVWWTLQMGPLPEVPLMDLDPARYAAILNNIMPELQDLWEGLADIARQRASPESRRTAQALQQVHASDYKVFLTKFLLLGQNWEHIPALRTALGNWACDCVFEHALTLVKRELAQQRDTAWGALDYHTEMAQAIEKLKLKQINEQRRKANLSLLDITEGKMVPSKQQMLGSAGETLGRPMTTLTVLGNGHCLAASVAMAVFGTATLTPLVVKHVVACLRDNPQFQEELHTAMELQGLMEEEDTRSFEERKDIYLNGLLAGNIWMDQPELSIMCQIYQTQIFVWQCDKDGEPPGLAVPQAQSTINYPNTVHLHLRDGHYEPMVPMDVLHQFARSETKALPDFLTTHTVQWVMDRHAILRVEAQAAAAATGAASAKVARPKPKQQQPVKPRNAAAVPAPQGRGADRTPPAGGASPMQSEPTTCTWHFPPGKLAPTTCTNQFAAFAEPIAEETPALESYTAGGSMDAGQGSGGVSTYPFAARVLLEHDLLTCKVS